MDAMTKLLDEYGEDDEITCINWIFSYTYFIDAFFLFFPDSPSRLPESTQMRSENKIFYFDVGQNHRGVFMRISEVSVHKYLLPNNLLHETSKDCALSKSPTCNTWVWTLLEHLLDGEKFILHDYSASLIWTYFLKRQIQREFVWKPLRTNVDVYFRRWAGASATRWLFPTTFGAKWPTLWADPAMRWSHWPPTVESSVATKVRTRATVLVARRAAATLATPATMTTRKARPVLPLLEAARRLMTSAALPRARNSPRFRSIFSFLSFNWSIHM